jgi:hypothetical protein
MAVACCCGTDVLTTVFVHALPPIHRQLVIAYHMEAAHMGEFTAKEFKDGLMKLGVDSIDKLRKKLPELRGELSSDVTFKPIYNYAYDFSREVGREAALCVSWRSLLAIGAQHAFFICKSSGSFRGWLQPRMRCTLLVDDSMHYRSVCSTC